jgi:NAD(P)-dependent dehydrogenase (short-subunit alcohol dehydrogenase family)
MIAGRHALVTGGGSGVGRTVALALAQAGVAVTICGRRKDQLEATAGQSKAIHPVVADVTDEAAIAALYDAAHKARGAFDIVVANAGVSGSNPAHRTSLADWQRTLDVNLTGSFLTVKPALAGMTSRKSGRIVFVASTAGLKGYAYVAPYVAAKHGVVGLMRALAVETAKTGVTVNAVCPGYTDTDLVRAGVERIGATTGRSADEALAGMLKSNPLGRLIRPDEVAGAVLFLCSAEASAVTGTTLAVAGGEV